MYDLIVFDLDGTLLDTIGDLAAAGNYALEKMGMPLHGEDEYKLFVGNGIPKLIERMLPSGHSAEEETEALRIFSEYYGKHKSDRTKPYKGMRELLDELSAEGITCVCNTNKAQEFSEELVRKFFGNLIKEVAGAGSGFPVKPAPDAAKELIGRFGGRALYVGDSGVDMQTAANAGTDACGVLWGFRSREELESFMPRYIAETVAQLRGIILGKEKLTGL